MIVRKDGRRFINKDEEDAVFVAVRDWQRRYGMADRRAIAGQKKGPARKK
jgi:hypothetical protein